MFLSALVLPHRYIRQKPSRFTPSDDCAVSNVIGVALMVSATVILSGVVASFAFSLDFGQIRPIAEEILDGDLVARP